MQNKRLITAEVLYCLSKIVYLSQKQRYLRGSGSHNVLHVSIAHSQESFYANNYFRKKLQYF